MNCTHTLWDLPDSLRCVRTDEHTTHSYESTTADEHADGGEAA